MGLTLEYELAYSPTAQALLDAPFDYSILFLDIMLDNGNDGILIGKKLRENGNTALFILTTSRKDRALDGYEATVFRYLVKPVSGEEVSRVLDAAIQAMEYDANVVAVKFKYQTDYIRVQDILYVESYLRRRYIITKEREYQTSASWNALQEQFSAMPYFFSVRKAILINMTHVTGQSQVSVTMTNGRKIKFAAGKYEQFLDAFSKFLNERI
jgi:DNA-binding LytR/AlgR family response regulator